MEAEAAELQHAEIHHETRGKTEAEGWREETRRSAIHFTIQLLLLNQLGLYT